MENAIWLQIARELEAIAQSGMEFTRSDYDRERYERVREIAAEILAAGSNLKTEELLLWNRSEMGYATPKVDVRGAVFEGRKVLLCRENADEGKWTLPGGWADVNEAPSAAVAREVREETGYDVRVLRLMAVYDRDRQGHTPPHPYHAYKLVFLCEIRGGTPTPTKESSGSAFFDIDQLPELSLARTLPRQIVRLHEKIQAWDAAADFD